MPTEHDDTDERNEGTMESIFGTEEEYEAVMMEIANGAYHRAGSL